MIFIKTSNSSEARRARRILFSGLATKFDLDGTSYSGVIIAVSENSLALPKTWTIQFKETQSVGRVAIRKSRVQSITAAVP